MLTSSSQVIAFQVLDWEARDRHSSLSGCSGVLVIVQLTLNTTSQWKKHRITEQQRQFLSLHLLGEITYDMIDFFKQDMQFSDHSNDRDIKQHKERLAGNTPNANYLCLCGEVMIKLLPSSVPHFLQLPLRSQKINTRTLCVWQVRRQLGTSGEEPVSPSHVQGLICVEMFLLKWTLSPKPYT